MQYSSAPELKTIVRAIVQADTATPSEEETAAAHDLIAALAERFGGEVACTEPNICLLFDRPSSAIGWAETLHRELAELGRLRETTFSSRIGIDAEEIHWSGDPGQIETAGFVAERLALLATHRQILVSGPVAALARATAGPANDSRIWHSHGPFRLGGGSEPVEVVEVGEQGVAPLTPPRSGTSGASPGLGPFVPGRQIGKYVIVEVIGRGGMGVIYRARDTELGRDVAIKTLPWSLQGRPERLRRFEREVRTLGALNHPNIVTLHTLGIAEGTRFLVMELIDGRTVDRLISEQGLTASRLLSLSRPLADALAAAHRKGIIHRDLKPSNVMVTSDDRVKVLDFGLAKPLGAEARPEDEATTQEGDLLGTMPYMAPERLRGDAGGPESDLFSLGILLYELAAGHRPFPARGYNVIQQILDGRFERLDAVRPDLPASFVDLVHDLLEPVPGDRPVDAASVAESLREIDLGEPTRPIPRPRKQERRGTNRLSLLVAPVVVAVLGLAIWLGRGFTEGTTSTEAPEATASSPALRGTPTTAEPIMAPAPRRIAVLPFSSLGGEDPDVFAAGLTTEVTSRLSAVQELEVISSRSTARFARGTETIREIGEILDVAWVVVGNVQWSTAGDDVRLRVTPQLVDARTESQIWSEVMDLELDDLFQVQSDIAENVVGMLDLKALGVETPDAPPVDVDPTAYRLFLRGLFLEGRPDYSPSHRVAVADAFAQATERDPEFARAWAHLSQASSMLVHLRHDASPERRALAASAATRATDLEPDAPSTHLARATLQYWVERRFEEALVSVESVLDAAPSNVEALAMGAYILRRQGHWELATERLGHAVTLSPEDPTLALQRGATALWRRDYEAATADLDRAIALAPFLAASHWYRAWVEWSRDGNLVESRRILERMPIGQDPRVHWYWWRQEMYEKHWDAAEKRLRNFPDGWVRTIEIVRPVAALRAEVLLARGAPAASVRDAWNAALPPLRGAVEAQPDDPRLVSSLAVVLAGLGHTEEARREALRAENLHKADAYEGPSYVEHRAWAATLLGDHTTAGRLLGDLTRRPSGISAALIGIDPRWSSLPEDLLPPGSR